MCVWAVHVMVSKFAQIHCIYVTVHAYACVIVGACSPLFPSDIVYFS